MKNTNHILIILMLLVSHSLFSQENHQCEKIGEKVFEAIDNNSSEILLPHLAENFIISGHRGHIAKSVLEQLFSQLKVNSYKIQNTITENNTTKLFYSVRFEGMDIKNSVFTFNKDCELETLELFKMEVKLLKEGDIKIEMPLDDFIEIPFELERNLIKVKVLLNGKKRPFLFDSGSPRVVLNSKHIQLNEEQTSISNTKGVTDKKISGMDIIMVENLNFKGIKINNQKILITNLSHLEKSLNTEIYGIIGYEIFKDYDLYIDYSNNLITFIKPDFFESFKESNLSNNNLVSVPFKMEGHIPVLEVQINDKKLSLGLDTGAEANLISDSLYPNFEKNLKDLKVDNLSGADSASIDAKSGILNEMSINNKTFNDLKTVFTNIEHLNGGNEIKIQGLIGFPVLSKQKTIISFKRKEILFVE